MLTIENVQLFGFQAAIRGMRNPKNSWAKSDSTFELSTDESGVQTIDLGPADLKLAGALAHSGPDDGKFLRMIHVQLDVTAPLYWWSEADTYKVGTVANSCSKMHKLLHKPFEMSDFSFDKLPGYKNNVFESVARPLVDTLNELRDAYFACDDTTVRKKIWYTILQLLPVSYNQRRTWDLNYAVLRNIYHARRNHKLDEWHTLCDWIEKLPYAEELICG